MVTDFNRDGVKSRRDCYVVHALKAGPSAKFDQAERHVFGTFLRAHRWWKARAETGWEMGLFWYNAKGQCERVRATANYAIEKDVPPVGGV